MATEASTKLSAGLDLHANNTFCAVINPTGQAVFQQRLDNDLPTICQALRPFQAQLQAVAVGADETPRSFAAIPQRVGSGNLVGQRPTDELLEA